MCKREVKSNKLGIYTAIFNSTYFTICRYRISTKFLGKLIQKHDIPLVVNISLGFPWYVRKCISGHPLFKRPQGEQILRTPTLIDFWRSKMGLIFVKLSSNCRNNWLHLLGLFWKFNEFHGTNIRVFVDVARVYKLVDIFWLQIWLRKLIIRMLWQLVNISTAGNTCLIIQCICFRFYITWNILCSMNNLGQIACPGVSERVSSIMLNKSEKRIEFWKSN